MSAALYPAIDTADLARARVLAQSLKPHVQGLKLGLEFFAGNGPDGIARLAEYGLPLFLDLKLHDIPATVAAAVRAAWRPGVALMTIHAAGGPTMLKAAVEAARERGAERLRLVGVTVLTSLDDRDLAATGQTPPVADQALRLALLARDCGLDGVVCSPHEVATLRARLGKDALLVVPGVRPAGAAAADQKRTLTPSEAARLGADILVVGRPITGAPDPAKAAAAIAAELRAL